MWGPTFWGNMWSARCDHVKKLISPYDIETKNQLAVDTKPPEMTMTLYTQQIERFALVEMGMPRNNLLVITQVSNHVRTLRE